MAKVDKIIGYAKGEEGKAATVSVGKVTTLQPTQNASVNNSGNASDAVLDFGIPKGNPGKDATVMVGAVHTLQPGEAATVQNSGTATAAILDFGIPRGDDGMTDLVAEYKDDWSHTCTPTVAAPVVIKEIAGKTEQVVTTGAQLLDQSKYAGGSVVNGVNIVLNDDGSMTLNGTTSQKGNVLSLHVSIPNGKYCFSVNATLPDGVYWQVNNNANNGSIGAIGAFDITDNGCYVYLLTKDSGVAINNVTLKLMINAGDTALPWEPYTGGKPGPNPDYPLDIKGVGNSGSLVVIGQGRNLYPIKAMDKVVSYQTELFPWTGKPMLYIQLSAKTNSSDGSFLINAGYYDKLRSRLGGNGYAKATGANWTKISASMGGIEASHSGNVDLTKVAYIKITFSVYQSTAANISFSDVMISDAPLDNIACQPYHHTTATIPLSSPLYDGDKICCVQPGESYVDAEGNVVTANRALWGVKRCTMKGKLYTDDIHVVSGAVSTKNLIIDGRYTGLTSAKYSENIINGVHSDDVVTRGKCTIAPPGSINEWNISHGGKENVYAINGAKHIYITIPITSLPGITASSTRAQVESAVIAYVDTHNIEVIFLCKPYFEPFPDQAPFRNLRSTNDLTYIYTDDPLKPEITVDVAKQAAGGYLLSGYMDREDGIMVDKTTGAECVLGMENGLLTVYEIEEE